MRSLFKKISGWNGGYIMILNTLLFIGIILVILAAISNLVIIRYSSSQGYVSSKQSYMVAHSAAEEAVYRLKNGINMPSSDTLTLPSGSATISVANTSTGKSITVNGRAGIYNRNIKIDLTLGTGISFHYGIQSGEGGFVLQNQSSVRGNVFSDGAVTGSGNTISGDVISAGPTGLISGIVATGTLYAHTLNNSSAGKDAYYYSDGTIDSYTNNHVTGTKHSGSDDQATATLPISDDQINQWESDASVGTTTCSSGTYNITSNTTIGSLKIPCDLSIKNATVTISGPIWVTGNIDIKGSTVDMSSGLTNKNVAIIADSKSNPTGSGIITTDTSTSFYAAGCPSACVSGAFIFLISQNSSAENSGSTDAISLGQSSSGVIAYASHGQITVAQSVNLKEVTAYKIILQNTADVTYDTGLPSTVFQSGPGGGYDILDWLEY